MAAPRYLTLEQFASISAQMDAGMPRDKALEHAGIPLEVWRTEQSYWLATLAQQVERKRYALHTRYTELFLAHRETAVHQLHAEKRRISGIMPCPPARPVASSLAFVGTNPAAPSAHSVPPAARAAPSPASAPRAATNAPAPAPTPAARLATSAPAPAPIPLTPALTVEQLATLQAEVTVAPDKAGEARSRFGLNATTHRQEEEIWKRLFASDRGLLDQYVRLFEYYKALISPSDD